MKMITKSPHKVEGELNKLCYNVIDTIDTHLLFILLRMRTKYSTTKCVFHHLLVKFSSMCYQFDSKVLSMVLFLLSRREIYIIISQSLR
jgi:hypothetical protein